MKKYFLVILLFTALSAQNFAQSNLKAYLAYSSFTTSDQQPFLETYLTVLGNTVIYKKNENGKFQGSVELSIAFIQNDKIINYKKYTLLSDELDSEVKPRTNFIDQQRFALPNGEYLLEFEIADKNAKSTISKFTEKIRIDFPAQQVVLSDIELIESYQPTVVQNILSKSGYDLVPYVSKYYPENFNTLTFYSEIYNTSTVLHDSDKFLVNYYLEDFDTKEKLSAYSNFKKYTAAKVNGLLAEFKIDKLETGNYNLCIEVRSRENKLLANRKMFFQRSNPPAEPAIDSSRLVSEIENTFVSKIDNIDSLAIFIDYLRSISSVSEVTYADNQLHAADLLTMQRFFYSFWQRRNTEEPEQEWLLYRMDVEEANRIFATTVRAKKGYASDRGRVYLKYGKPTIRSVSDHEPSAYPFEIWQYDRTRDGQNNRRFVFYNPYSGSNDYRLIHSDARSEVFDARWKFKITDRKVDYWNTDPTKRKDNLDNENLNEDSFGSQLEDLYRNPR